MIFVTGVHGVGKTVYSELLSKSLGIQKYSSGEILITAGIQKKADKSVKNVMDNQKILIKEIREKRRHTSDFILDGHLTLINGLGEFERIECRIFQELGITEIIYLLKNTSVVRKQLHDRDGIYWNEKFIKEFVKYDLQYAAIVAERLNIPLHVIKNAMPETRSRAIIMPIKKIYADYIMTGEKKFEFRKNLCNQSCNEMVLYATSPYKSVIGKVSILGKVSLTKETLWKYVSPYAGITWEQYCKYFAKVDNASAYILGTAERFIPERTLLDYGINYNPQSFIYI